MYVIIYMLYIPKRAERKLDSVRHVHDLLFASADPAGHFRC